MNTKRTLQESTSTGARSLRALGVLADLPPPFCRLVPARRLELDGVIVTSGGPLQWTIASAIAPGARGLDDDAFMMTAWSLLLSAVSALRETTEDQLARVWSFIPGINEPSTHGDRYMTFNVGRAMAFESMAPRLDLFPAASGVGHSGDSLVVHALALPGEILALEGPRQTPAWQYSTRYGERPPLFSRACVVRHGQRSHFLASGTASVLGEDTVHRDDLDLQLDETLSNLERLCSAAQLAPRDALRNLRVHIRPECAIDAPRVQKRVRQRLPEAQIDTVIAPLCRAELMVEIEGSSWAPAMDPIATSVMRSTAEAGFRRTP